MSTADSAALSRLPSIDRILARPEVLELVGLYGRETVRVQARALVEEARQRLRAGEAESAIESLQSPEAWLRAGLEERLGGRLRRVLNATGIFLHTNLGRAPLPPPVWAELRPQLTAGCDLELDLASGRRRDRNRRVGRLLPLLTGAEAAVVVNNNAAALVLAVSTLAAGREVILSRGELVEIGGSFRLPDILAAAGARLVEVGTTNRTRLADYRAALSPATALLLKVHPSNFKIRGFVAEVEAVELAALAREHDLPMVVDEGAGLLRPHEATVLRHHPSVSELLEAGADLVCASGDKLLGGPQAGLLVGRRTWVERCRQHPLYRALRPSRMTYAALEAVLGRHLAGAGLPLDQLWPEATAHAVRLERVAAAVGGQLVAAEAYLGGGAGPDEAIPGQAVALPGSEGLARRLRLREPAVVGYLRRGNLILDLRTVDPADDDDLIAAVLAAQAAT